VSKGGPLQPSVPGLVFERKETFIQGFHGSKPVRKRKEGRELAQLVVANMKADVYGKRTSRKWVGRFGFAATFPFWDRKSASRRILIALLHVYGLVFEIYILMEIL
jgi:hypothetical protein